MAEDFKWLVIARTDGMGESRIVSNTSWKGWPKVKDYAGNVVPEQRMAGKNVVHVIGESEDGKTIAPGLIQPKREHRPLVVPPEAQEIVAKKTIGPDGLTEAPSEAVEVAEEIAAPTEQKNKGGRPRKDA